MLSARAGEEARVEGISSGADDYLVKPFGARELRARVRAHIELARARREAAAADERAALILDSVTDAFMALDSDWRFTYMNAEAERINGVKRGELLGKSHWDVFPMAVGTIVDREFRRAVTEQVSVEFENFHEPYRKWFGVRAYPSRDGGLSVYFRDITERKLAENAAQARTEQLKKLAEIASRLHSASDVASLLGVITAEARILIGAKVAVTSVADGDGDRTSVNAVSTPSGTKVAGDTESVPSDAGLYAALKNRYRPLRLTRAQLAEDPEWSTISDYDAGLEAANGWIGAASLARMAGASRASVH